jgi:hypothetical protein
LEFDRGRDDAAVLSGCIARDLPPCGIRGTVFLPAAAPAGTVHLIDDFEQRRLSEHGAFRMTLLIQAQEAQFCPV